MIILSFICGALEREGYTTAMCMDEDRLKPHKLESGIPGLEFDMSALLSVRSGQFGDTDYHLTRAAVVFTPSKSMSESEEDLYLDQLYALYPQFAHSFWCEKFPWIGAFFLTSQKSVIISNLVTRNFLITFLVSLKSNL